MKQILQSLKTGVTEVAELPCPAVGRGQLLIRSRQTLVSVGTERMLVEFGKAGWIDKARQQPDKVRMVLDKIKTDGLSPTVEAVFNKLDQPLPLGYCNVGEVVDLGVGVHGFAVGDRVVSNGKHAQMVSVPVNLCAKIPDPVSDEEAVFTILAAIGLQGIRLAAPTLGENVVVTGLGLIGILTVQLLLAQGCRVLGLDYDRQKLDLAKQLGASVVDLAAGEDPIAVSQQFSRGRGVDAVLITAATKSNEPVHQAAVMCRKRGRIVLVGVTGLELSRADFYEKELSFQVSCSYGPGRYDVNYEERGVDYPIGHVRWTEQRNFEAVLDMMASRRITARDLISHRFPIDEAEKAYALMSGTTPVLGILLTYPSQETQPTPTLRQQTTPLPPSTVSSPVGKTVVAFLGAGNYATALLIPSFKKTTAQLHTVVSHQGVSGFHAGRKFGFQQTTTDSNQVFQDSRINCVVVTTRHDSHAGYVVQALQANKHVFVEKPLCLTHQEADAIEQAYGNLSSPPVLMVGFNRRFAPQIRKMKSLLEVVTGPKALVMTVNAGAIPAQHWTQDATLGGGRIVGEACHFIDLLRHLVGQPLVDYGVTTLPTATTDTVTLQLTFADGSMGTIHYFANGHKSFPKERLEVFVGGRILQLDNFRRLAAYGWPGFKHLNLWRQDKGQAACSTAFIDAIEQGKPSPIPFAEIMEVARVSIDLASAART